MKALYFIFVIILSSVIFQISSSYGYDWACIDPGHGGPEASKYGPNGDGHGNCGPVLGLSEQWVNLQVGLELKDLIIYGTMFPVIMTRWTEQPQKLLTEFLKTTKLEYSDNSNLTL
jgi:hypothetical protein